MAEAGIGVDIVEIARMERIMRDTPGFFPRMFTEEERQYCEASARPAAHYACRFAAREAVLKALGVGFGQEGVGRKDVSVSRDANGRPLAVLSGGALISLMASLHRSKVSRQLCAKCGDEDSRPRAPPTLAIYLLAARVAE